MTFRRATFEDGVTILRLLKEWKEKANLEALYGIPMDFDSSLKTIDNIIENGIFLVGTTSYAGAILTPCWWNQEATMATVIMWYFRSPREIKIFKALMDECREAGATHFVSASIFPEHTIGRLYKRFGFSECEAQWIREL